MPKATDNNQSRIVSALRQAGATVTTLHEVGRGCPDLLVGFRGRNYLMEIKDGRKVPSRRRLTETQIIWHAHWRGQVDIVNSVEEALDLINIDGT